MSRLRSTYVGRAGLETGGDVKHEAPGRLVRWRDSRLAGAVVDPESQIHPPMGHRTPATIAASNSGWYRRDARNTWVHRFLVGLSRNARVTDTMATPRNSAPTV